MSQIRRLYKLANITRANLRILRIASKTTLTANEFSITDLMKSNQHDHLDILKMDIEGGEHEIVPMFLQEIATKGIRVCQLLIEVHGSNEPTKWLRLLAALEKHRFYLFAKEINLYCLKRAGWIESNSTICVELAYIHQNCLKNFRIHDENFSLNFPTNLNEFGIIKKTVFLK